MGNLPRVDLEPFSLALERADHYSRAFTCSLVIQEALKNLREPPRQTKGASRRFDFLFHEFRSQVGVGSDALETIALLNDFIFKNKQFTATPDSRVRVGDLFLGEVLEQREGSALALALIYREVAQRLGLDAVDFVNFPGYSLIKLLYRHQLLFIDPAESGRLLSVKDLQERLAQKYGREVVLSASFLETPTEFHVVGRFLAKLKNLFFDLRDWTALLAVLDFTICMNPQKKSDYKERGLLLYQLGQNERAFDDLRHFIQSARPSPEVERLSHLVEQMQNPSVTPLF